MANTQIHKSDIYVFDAAVPDVQTLIDAVTATAGTGARIIILPADSDGVLQLADALAGESV